MGNKPGQSQGGTPGVAAEELPLKLPAINRLGVDAPVNWLKKGWQDLQASRFVGCFYGLIFVLMGYAIVWIYANKWQLTMGLIGGFFLMGPFLCTGLYDLSRQRELGGKVSLLSSLSCWRRNTGSIAFFTVMLTFCMIVWARVSLILFALSASTTMPTVQGVLRQIFSFENPQFIAWWSGIGFVFASIVFAIGVVSVPMMIDRKCDTFSAVFSSVRSVHSNPKVLYLWALLVVLIIGASLLAGFLPLLITAPLIGHASWHAYRDLVSPSSEP